MFHTYSDTHYNTKAMPWMMKLEPLSLKVREITISVKAFLFCIIMQLGFLYIVEKFNQC
jgi:hypothetical protein